MTHPPMQFSRKRIITSHILYYCILQETHARNSFPTKSYLDVPQPKTHPSNLSFRLLLTLHVQPFWFWSRMPCSQALWCFAWGRGCRVDINGTGTRHGVAAGDCPSVHTHTIITLQLSRFWPPPPPPRPWLSTYIHHRRSAYVAWNY
jgi:hypothetical protein